MGRRHWWMGGWWPELGRGRLTISQFFDRQLILYINIQDIFLFKISAILFLKYLNDYTCTCSTVFYRMYRYLKIAFPLQCWKHYSVFMYYVQLHGFNPTPMEKLTFNQFVKICLFCCCISILAFQLLPECLYDVLVFSLQINNVINKCYNNFVYFSNQIEGFFVKEKNIC